MSLRGMMVDERGGLSFTTFNDQKVPIRSLILFNVLIINEIAITKCIIYLYSHYT